MSTTNRKAITSFVLGIVTVALIPVITFLFAPCGFPLSLVAGIAAATLAPQARREIAAFQQNGEKLARAGKIMAWTGMALNTVIMLIKLAMFVVMWVLPLAAIILAGKSN